MLTSDLRSRPKYMRDTPLWTKSTVWDRQSKNPGGRSGKDKEMMLDLMETKLNPTIIKTNKLPVKLIGISSLVLWCPRSRAKPTAVQIDSDPNIRTASIANPSHNADSPCMRVFTMYDMPINPCTVIIPSQTLQGKGGREIRSNRLEIPAGPA